MLLTRQLDFERANADLPDEDKDRMKKLRESMKNTKIVIHERYTAWMNAMRIWQCKLQGFDIHSDEFKEKFRAALADERILRTLSKKGEYLSPYLRSKWRRKLKYGRAILTNEKEQLTHRMQPFKIKPTEPGIVLDMTPISDRKHRSRRRVGKFRLKNRAIV